MALGSVAFALLLGVFALQWRAQGDYHYFNTGLDAPPLRLVIQGLPRVVGTSPTRWRNGHYFSTGSKVFIRRDKISLEAVSDYYYKDTSNQLFPPGVPAFEKYPVGTLTGFQKAVESENWTVAVDEARKLQAAFPARATPKYLLIASLLAHGETSEADELFTSWKTDIESDATFRADWYIELLKNDFLASQPEQERARAYLRLARPLKRDYPYDPHSITPDYFEALPIDMDESLDWFRGIGDRSIPREFSLNRMSGARSLLTEVVLWKAACTLAIFQRMDGDVADAHTLLLGLYRASCRQHIAGSVGDHLLAVVLKSFTIECMQTVYAQSSLRPDQIKYIWNDLEEAFRKDKFLRVTPLEILRSEQPWARNFPPLPGSTNLWEMPGADPEFIQVRLETVAAQRELLRASLRARFFWATHGEWPSEEQLFNAEHSALRGPATLDPFAPSGTNLKTIALLDSLVVYSLGPDGVDDGAATEFDRGVGEVSGGDIVITLRQKPYFDFPEEPGHTYRDLGEFDQRYPMGLPNDYFSNGARSPLRLARDGSGRVWSWGPDTDEPAAPYDPYLGPAEEHYDPTNGITSAGDLWLQLKFENPPLAEALSD